MNSGAILMSRKQQFKLDIVLRVNAGEIDRTIKNYNSRYPAWYAMFELLTPFDAICI